MEGFGTVKEGDMEKHFQTIGVALTGSKKSKSILRWALENFVLEGLVAFKLIHVNPKITRVPTPMGNSIPISQVRGEVAAAYKKEVEWKAEEMLLPYKKWCTLKNVEVDVIMIESDNVANAIAEVVVRYAIERLVIGTSAIGKFSWKQKNSLSSKISESAPSFCMVLSISEGKLSVVRPPNLENNPSDDGNGEESWSSATFSSAVSQTGLDSSASSSGFNSPNVVQMLQSQALSVTPSKATTVSLIPHSKHARRFSEFLKEPLNLESSPSSSTSDINKAKKFYSGPLAVLAAQPSKSTTIKRSTSKGFAFISKLTEPISSTHYKKKEDNPSCPEVSKLWRKLHKLKGKLEMLSMDTTQRDHSSNLPPLDMKKKQPNVRQKKQELQKEVVTLQQMLQKEEKIHEILERSHNEKGGSNINIPNFLPPKAKQILTELTSIEDEIARLEAQISQLQNGVKKEQEVNKEIKSRQRDFIHASPTNRFIQQRRNGPEHNIANSRTIDKGIHERTGFETKALHYISKAMKGGYSVNDFSVHRSIDSRGFFDKKEYSFLEEVKPLDKVSKKSGLLKSPSPMRDPRHPSPKLRERNPVLSSELPPKPVSGNIQLQQDHHNMQPNKLSESIMQCLLFIYVRLLRTSRTMELEKSGTISRSSNFSLNSRSFRADNNINSNTLLQKELRQQDPYGVFNMEESIPRDIGPYKNLVIFTSNSMDPKCISNPSSVSLVRKLRALLTDLQKVDLRQLTLQQKLAFWINMYNACIMHGFLQYGVPSNPDKLLTLMNKATLNIGGNTINAQAIEYFILRKPESVKMKEVQWCGEKDDKETIVRELYGLEFADPNVTFALCCGTRSSPAVRIYTAEGVVAELEKAKHEYLQASIIVTNKRIAFPELLLRNMLDFAVDVDALVEWVCNELPTSGTLRKSMVDCFRNYNSTKISGTVEKIPYDYEFQYLLAI